jgi:hypothetical protein
MVMNVSAPEPAWAALGDSAAMEASSTGTAKSERTWRGAMAT